MGNDVEQPCETSIPIVLTYVRIPLLNQPKLCVKPWREQKLVTDVLGDDPTVQQWNLWWQNCAVRKRFVRSFWNDVQCCRTEDAYSAWRRDCHRALQPYLSLRGGGYAALCGSSIALPLGENGLLTPELVEQSIRKQKGHNRIIRWQPCLCGKYGQQRRRYVLRAKHSRCDC